MECSALNGMLFFFLTSAYKSGNLKKKKKNMEHKEKFDMSNIFMNSYYLELPVKTIYTYCFKTNFWSSDLRTALFPWICKVIMNLLDVCLSRAFIGLSKVTICQLCLCNCLGIP